MGLGDTPLFTLILIFGLLPIYVIEFQGILPLLLQLAFIAIPLILFILFIRKKNLGSFAKFIFGVISYIITVALSNFALMRIFGM